MGEILTIMKKHPKLVGGVAVGAAIWVGTQLWGTPESGHANAHPSATSSEAQSSGLSCTTKLEHIAGGKIVISAVVNGTLPEGAIMEYEAEARRKNPPISGTAPAGATNVTVNYTRGTVTNAEASFTVPGAAEPIHCKPTSD
ncbi:MAG TPA: hypothetical protein VMR45_05700 [Patescibacteria group bacterium]|nr:hypothetical protein [Patescibacteria group bacterium]